MVLLFDYFFETDDTNEEISLSVENGDCIYKEEAIEATGGMLILILFN